MGLTRVLGGILCFALFLNPVQAVQSVTLAWDPSPDSNVTGYRVYDGVASRSYTNMVDAGNANSVTISNLVVGVTYYFAARAYNVLGMESEYSDEISYTVPSTSLNRPPTLNALNNLVLSAGAGQQTVNLSGISSGASNEVQTLTVTTSSSNVGLIPTPTVTYTSPNATGTLRFTPVALANGVATITVTVNDGGASNNVVTRSFTVTVTNPAPIVALTSPLTGASYTAPASISLAASVTANGYTITKVQFYNGATLLGEDPSSPYAFTWSSVSAGSYSLTARAVYDAGSTVASASVNLNVTAVTASGTTHYDFTYANRASLLADGWDFLGRTASGATRNTEQTSGVMVNYDQVAHPGVLRIPADTGDLWSSMNDTRNTAFRNLPTNWTSLRLKLSFAPTQNSQQAGIVAYQDDDNYVQVTRIYNGGNKVSFARETGGSPVVIQSTAVTATTNLHLRLDRDLMTGTISGMFSLDGVNWVSVGSVTQTLSGPRLGIFVGASPGGYPNADLSWVEIMAPQTAPVLTVSPGNLTFAVVQGTSPASRSIGITNSGSGTLNWTAVTDGTAPAWLTVSPANGASNGTISVSVASTSLAAGVYSKSITVTAVGATNSPQTVSVNLTVTNPSPTIALTAPANGASYTAPASMSLAANVTANGNTITKVQFYNGTTLLAEDASAPYSFVWSSVSAGSYSLTARAVYGTGSTVASSSANVTVTSPLPIIALTSPLNGASYPAPASISLAASVTANGHTITKVQFYNGATLLGEDTSSPYAFTWSSVTAGSYSLTARAVYGAGSTVASASVNLNVTGLPAPWQTTDIGNVSAAGSANVSNGVYTVKGAGNISGTADNFRFVYQPLSGDGEIKVRLNSVENTGTSGRIGVMIRESLTGGSKSVFMGISPDGTFRWQRRVYTGGNTVSRTSTIGMPPNALVRLVRTGNTLYGYRSTDGTNWTQVSYLNTTMATNIYFGLAVASGSSNLLNTATFTNVTAVP